MLLPAASARLDLLPPATLRPAFPFPSFPSPWPRSKRLRMKPVFAAFPQEPRPRSSSSSFSSSLSSHFRDALLFLLFAASIVGARSLLGLLPSDFSDRWRRLLASAEGAESQCAEISRHLVQAVVAAEDRRFFLHAGVDPVGLARAVVYFPRGGGGSTITQQLVKNVFLKNERKLSRKLMEIILALILERRLSKQKILYSYISKIYWGHGKYGIKSASIFYFGKQPSLLSVGESAMLAGMLPAPEILSPFKHQSRGKLPQARALKKMVEAGFIDMKVALLVASQTLYFHGDESEKVSQFTRKQTKKSAVIGEIWDWEDASRVWEVKEYLESWALKKRKKSNFLLKVIPLLGERRKWLYEAFNLGFSSLINLDSSQEF